MTPITVLIAEDNESIRHNISTYLTPSDDIHIVGEAVTGYECLQLYKRHQADVCLLTVDLPQGNGIETAVKIRNISSETKLVMLSGYIDQEILYKALNIGINGYLLTNTKRRGWAHGIHSVMNGKHIYSEQVAKVITRSFCSQNYQKTLPGDHKITAREREILQLIVDGYTSKEIANTLYISPHTVETHRANLMEKLKLKNIAQLVRYAIEHKLVTTK